MPTQGTPQNCLTWLPAGKAKSLHALNLVPSIELDAASLSALPEGCTPSPLDQGARSSKRTLEDQV